MERHVHKILVDPNHHYLYIITASSSKSITLVLYSINVRFFTVTIQVGFQLLYMFFFSNTQKYLRASFVLRLRNSEGYIDTLYGSYHTSTSF